MIAKFDYIRVIYWKLIDDYSQRRCIVRFLKAIEADSSWKILDVGCGRGRNLWALKHAGLIPSGVEINAVTAADVRAQGFECFSPTDENLDRTEWDVLIMSHIIEHFDHLELANVLDRYLRILKKNGYIIIASPLMSSRFYDNFDHVKPYTPSAIEEFFGRRGAQTRAQSIHQLELINLWFRRSPPQILNKAALLKREISVAKIVFASINVLLSLLHVLSFRIVGIRDGWVGLYRKVE